MPPALAPLPYPYSSIPGSITPTPQHNSQSGTYQKQQQQQPLDITSNKLHHHRTAPWRVGLPTPPSEMMNGVAYNAYLPPNPLTTTATTTPGSYGNNRNGLPMHSKPQYQLASAKPAESGSQKKSSLPSYLQIPSSISDTNGNLAEFAAQMTCLFWFESTAKLNAIENRLGSLPTLVPEVTPALGFQKWVTTVLSTTQVSQNVILLALMFIYRLKKFNSGVKGKSGSEFRLLTIALMLGNKFLDDNTYTNKTWAEVSGISVQEIHIMEVEFLSNIRYNLFASAEEWTEWHSKLRRFFEFYHKASLVPEGSEQLLPKTPPALRISPSLGSTPPLPSLSPGSKLPSPPVNESLRALPNWNAPMNNGSYAPLPRLGNEIPSSVSSRKRSRDEPAEEHPMKRVAVSTNPPVATLPPSSALPSIPTLPPVLTPTSAPASQAPMARPVSQLPRPNIPVSSNLAPSVPSSLSHQLPPVSVRTGPSSYNTPTSASNWAPQMPSTTVPSMSNGMYTTPMSLPDPGRHHLGVTSATVSPALSAYSVHTSPTHLSPSFWLANRNSPYRPVRSVNTLLIPPPSASLQQNRPVPYDHMHYQPLGKPAAERRTGLVPYLHQDAWPQGPIAQPVFHPTPKYSG
ncbi:putative mucin [Aspergillus ruber CBS 135680]|uniref:Cyclin-domain-containing protein n=1 Tax=Aspergillus ruber (strain CBS 135680) TaxID=1388766 RepID=A0A017SEJ6_ASPRC|nr:uncharacterized protein EURHEDRAFT_500121 [Aspergillus ruber CBS 135680]EYE95443.1 hypothetical protein EURHEDRAFT_500121 [Aspergillus ruber CBS 135680]